MMCFSDIIDDYRRWIGEAKAKAWSEPDAEARGELECTVRELECRLAYWEAERAARAMEVVE